MVARGLRAPLLVMSDGAPGLLGAVELVSAHSLHQRCLIHYAEQRIMPSWRGEPLWDRGCGLLKSA
jgi:transposase-like protein